MTFPLSGPALLNAGVPSRSRRPRSGHSRCPSAGTTSPQDLSCPASAPAGTAMHAASGRVHIANAGRLGSGPALGPQEYQ
jgi:hypothetical protein